MQEMVIRLENLEVSQLPCTNDTIPFLPNNKENFAFIVTNF